MIKTVKYDDQTTDIASSTRPPLQHLMSNSESSPAVEGLAISKGILRKTTVSNFVNRPNSQAKKTASIYNQFRGKYNFN